MIVKGKSRGAGAQLGRYVMEQGKNEKVELLQVRGTIAGDAPGAILEMESLAIGTDCTKPLRHCFLSPADGETLTPEQWIKAADLLQEAYGMDYDPARVLTLHTKEGKQHLHAVFARIDPETMTAWHDGWDYPKHEAAARAIEREFGLQRVQGVFVERDPDTPRPERTPETWEMRQGERLETDPRDFRQEVRDLFSQSDSGQAFAAALADHDITLCRGDRRDFVLLDDAGGVHSLGRVLGQKAAPVRDFMADVDRDALPTVAEVRAQSRSIAPEIEAAPPLATFRAGAVEATADHRKAPDVAEAREVRRRHEPEEPRRVARESEDAAPRLAILGNSAGRVLGHVLQTLGDVLDYFMGTRPTQGHAAPKIEAEPEPGPTIQEQRRQTLRTSAETIGQDPNAQSLAQSMNLDEDIRQRAAEIARRQRDHWLEEERERDR